MSKFQAKVNTENLFKLFFVVHSYEDRKFFKDKQNFSINYYLISWFPVCKRDDWSEKITIAILTGNWKIS